MGRNGWIVFLSALIFFIWFGIYYIQNMEINHQGVDLDNKTPKILMKREAVK